MSEGHDDHEGVVDARELLGAPRSKKELLGQATVEVDVANMVLCSYDPTFTQQAQVTDEEEEDDAMDVEEGDDNKKKRRGDRYQRAAKQLTQLLINELFDLPVERSQVGPLAVLTAARVASKLRQRPMPLPREKPIPQPKPETRWEKFAKEKGIQKHKRSRMELDTASGEYRPRYGYKSVRNTADQNEWIIEEKQHPVGSAPASDPKAPQYEDPFLKKRAEKRERIQAQQKQERRNANAAAKGAAKSELSSSAAPLINVSTGGSAAMSQARLSRAIKLAQRSTRSMGDHDVHRPDEPAMKKAKHKPTAAKRFGTTLSERESQLKLASKVADSVDQSISEKSVNAMIAKQNEAAKAARPKNKRNLLK
jgi:regulator of ribosome biosynthesis